MYRITPHIFMLIVCVLFTGFGVSVAAEWEFADEEDGIKSYRKDEANNPVTAFMGEAIIDAPLAKVAWVIRDNDHRTKWVDRLKLSRVLEVHSPWDKVIYQHFALPWPIADRDYVYRATVGWEGEKLAFNLKSTKSAKSPTRDAVRAHLSRCIYHLTPRGENKTHIRVEVHTDPRGSLPSWLVNLIQKSWPIKTLKGIRKMVKQPYAEISDLPPR